MIRIIKNTYPKLDGIAHAEPGDVCQWQHTRGHYTLIRLIDGKTVFSIGPVNSAGLLNSGKRPNLFGTIGEVKSKGHIFEAEQC